MEGPYMYVNYHKISWMEVSWMEGPCVYYRGKLNGRAMFKS